MQVSPPRFEHLDSALGVGTPAPRLSWRTDAPAGWVQTGWELKVERGTETTVATGRGDAQVLVDWPFEPLSSRERASVSVRVGGADGTWSPWSDPAEVEAGLLAPEDWAAHPVGAGWPEEPGTERRPAQVRRAFDLPQASVRARLYVTAHGLYEVEINGRRVGDHELSPGWTSYDERLVYWTFDVTDLVREGGNVIGSWLADGWYRGRLGFGGGYRDLYGTDQSLIAQLEVHFADGTSAIIATDESWDARLSPIHASGLYDGETHDLRDEQAGWSTPGGSEDGWSPVAVHRRDPATLVAAAHPPVRCVEEVAPRAVTRLSESVHLIDFGQNLVGRLRLRVRGAAGSAIELRHAEVLEHGALGIRPLRLAAAHDTVILDGTETVWEPRFTVHGFRYATVSGLTDLDEREVVARVIHSDMRRTGHLETSNADVNRLHENVVWGMKGNFVSIPTDCPQRDERLGWTGDVQVFAPTASFLFDSAGFLSNWLTDVAVEQHPDGTVPWFVPEIPGGPMWTPAKTGAVWGDVAVLTPWTLYERFADRGVLERQYDSARRWVERMIDQAGESRLWHDAQQLGDWLDPAAPPDDPADARTDRYLVASAYFAWSTRRLAETAQVVGRVDDATRYARIAAEARAAFRGEYVQPDGRLTSDAQTAYALAIRFDLLEPGERTSAGERLAHLVREAGNTIATGFVGTPLISDALTDTGHLDVAYALLLETECPSWLYTVRMGGTTIWERWDSMLPDGSINPGEMTSFNHFALGSVADWMHRVIGGLTATAPGYRRIEWAPRPGGALTHASVAFDSPYGRIEGTWRHTDEGVEYRLAVPTGVDGVVTLPDGSSRPIQSGGSFVEVVPLSV